MGRKEVRSFNKIFSTESLTTYKGNPLFNINYLAVAFLYDFPSIAGNPDELSKILERYRLNKATKRDKIIVEVLKNRLSSFNEGKETARLLEIRYLQKIFAQ